MFLVKDINNRFCILSPHFSIMDILEIAHHSTNIKSWHRKKILHTTRKKCLLYLQISFTEMLTKEPWNKFSVFKQKINKKIIICFCLLIIFFVSHWRSKNIYSSDQGVYHRYSYFRLIHLSNYLLIYFFDNFFSNIYIDFFFSFWENLILFLSNVSNWNFYSLLRQVQTIHNFRQKIKFYIDK